MIVNQYSPVFFLANHWLIIQPFLPVTTVPGASYDFNSTVEFGARKLTLSWNRGEDPKAVADRFLRRWFEALKGPGMRDMDDFLIENHSWLVVWNMNLIFPNSWGDDPI